MQVNRKTTLTALIALALASSATGANAPVHGPRLCLDARLWNTPGWQPRDGDFAYVKVTPERDSLAHVRKALGDIPATSRMLRSSTLDGMEKLLHELDIQGFKIGSLGYDLGASPVESSKRGRALSQKFGLTFFAFASRKPIGQSAEELARAADLVSIDDTDSPDSNPAAVVDRQRRFYQNLQAVDRAAVLFQNVNAAAGDTPHRVLRYYRANADLLSGIVISADSTPQAERLLRVIRPELGRAYAAAPDAGPSMYFFTFNWKTPGWQPRKGDYATAKIRPQLKTFDEKVAYVLEDLKSVAPENRMVQFNTLSGAAELLKEVIENRHFPIACIGYDLEDWDLTAGNEKQDPIGACKYGQTLASKYGLDFIVTPDMPMGRKWGRRVAPFIDAIKPQCKGLQAEDIEKAIEYQRNLNVEIRRANPDIRILHDVGISPKGVLQTQQGLLSYFAGVADLVDGIGIFSVNTLEQNAVIEKYIVGIRPPARPQ